MGALSGGLAEDVRALGSATRLASTQVAMMHAALQMQEQALEVVQQSLGGGNPPGVGEHVDVRA